MKIRFVLLLAIGLFPVASAQSVPDSSRYAQGMQMIDEARSAEQFLLAARFFRSMAEQHEGLWLAHYYAGLSFTLASHEDATEKIRDSLIDSAQSEVDKALEIIPGEPEVLILQAFVFQARIIVNPIARGLTYSMKASSMLQKAMEENPDNPRAYLLKAYNTYYTPALVGGGPENALPLFIEARDKFDEFRPGSAFAPHWGREETDEMIETCRSEISP